MSNVFDEKSKGNIFSNEFRDKKSSFLNMAAANQIPEKVSRLAGNPGQGPEAAFVDHSHELDLTSNWITTFNPVLTQGNVINYTLNKSQWHYDGDIVEWEAYITAAVNQVGTVLNAWQVTLPIPALSGINRSMGSAMLYDSSANVEHICVGVTVNSTTAMQFWADQALGSLFGDTPAIIISENDQLNFLVRYRWK